MKKIVRLTESDLTRIVKRVISEEGRISFEQKVSIDCGTKKMDGFVMSSQQVTYYCSKDSKAINNRVPGWRDMLPGELDNLIP
jgi:hypothetical protein